MNWNKIIVAPDSFKDSISAPRVCRVIQDVIIDNFPQLTVESIPVSDGGEGFLEILTENLNLQTISLSVMGPAEKSVEARYGISQKTAYIEMSQASGLQHLSINQRNPLRTTTYGLGQLIKDALNRGFKEIVLGIGGSATCDGGAGMAQALGCKFYDHNGAEISEPLCGGMLKEISDIDCKELQSKILDCNFKVASDVTNPLLGENGAVYVYAPQKGARPKDLEILEKNMQNLNTLFENKLNKNIKNIAGAGAAGGLGAGLAAFLNAELKSGSQFILNLLDFENKIRNASAIITGEGRIDGQTIDGKIISEVIKSARNNQIPVFAICGQMQSDQIPGIEKTIALTDYTDQNNAIKNPEKYLKMAAKDLITEIVSLRHRRK